MSTPPSAESITSGSLRLRSSRMDRYSSRAMSAARVTSTLRTGSPLIVSARMSRAFATASSGECASFTPPALPRPPTSTCALITTVPPSAAAMSPASSGVTATCPGSTGSP